MNCAQINESLSRLFIKGPKTDHKRTCNRRVTRSLFFCISISDSFIAVVCTTETPISIGRIPSNLLPNNVFHTQLHITSLIMPFLGLSILIIKLDVFLGRSDVIDVAIEKQLSVQFSFFGIWPFRAFFKNFKWNHVPVQRNVLSRRVVDVLGQTVLLPCCTLLNQVIIFVAQMPISREQLFVSKREQDKVVQ